MSSNNAFTLRRVSRSKPQTPLNDSGLGKPTTRWLRDLVAAAAAGNGRRGPAAPSQGLTVLFAGSESRDRLRAADAVATELGRDLWRVDLSAIVSRTIGETEKNLSRLLDAAERAKAVLLFDEADALFGKRTGVTDSHDRYANQEIGYVLQRLEEFAGLVIIATNDKRPFARLRTRFNSVVDIPPDTAD